jgi:serine/threonine protein kinase
MHLPRPCPHRWCTTGSLSHICCCRCAAQILLEAARALLHLHQHGLIHSDVKADNVLLKTSGSSSRRSGLTAKLADFGLAKVLREGSSLANVSGSGTLTHLAPELFETGSDVTTAVDAYSFGIMMWEAYCGRRVYSGMARWGAGLELCVGGWGGGGGAGDWWRLMPCGSVVPGAAWCCLVVLILSAPCSFHARPSSLARHLQQQASHTSRAATHHCRADIIQAVLFKRARPEFPPSTPPAFAELARRCWAHERDERPAFEEVVAELDGIVQQLQQQLEAEQLLQQQRQQEPATLLSGRSTPGSGEKAAAAAAAAAAAVAAVL